MTKEPKHIYQLELTERQTRLLSWACDTIARIIEGQDRTYQHMMEAAWEKRCTEATGKMIDDEWDGGWHNMRHDAERMSQEMKRRFWGLECNELNGVKYDDTSDILYDIHTVIRHELWLTNPNRSEMTVDAYKPTFTYGSEPIAKVSSKIEKNGKTCGTVQIGNHIKQRDKEIKLV
jgi:hypothetical protein